MSKQPKPITQVMSDLFPNSAKVLSEQLNTEQFNSFTTDASEAAARIEALQDGNQKMKADLDTALARATTAEGSLTTLQGQFSALETESKGLKESNQKLQSWYDNQKKDIDSTKNQQVEGLPDHIASLPENHPNRMAVESTLRNQARSK